MLETDLQKSAPIKACGNSLSKLAPAIYPLSLYGAPVMCQEGRRRLSGDEVPALARTRGDASAWVLAPAALPCGPLLGTLARRLPGRLGLRSWCSQGAEGRGCALRADSRSSSRGPVGVCQDTERRLLHTPMHMCLHTHVPAAPPLSCLPCQLLFGLEIVKTSRYARGKEEKRMCHPGKSCRSRCSSFKRGGG